MAQNYDANDLLWTTTGDLLLDQTKDLGSTDFDPLLAIAQDIYDRCKSDLGDYTLSPLIGASLSDFVGEPNNARNGAAIKERVISSLNSYGVINRNDFTVDTFPVSPYAIAVAIQLRCLPTARNKYSTLINTVINYNYKENHIVGRVK